MVRPGAMCGSVIVGGKHCGFAGECEHKRDAGECPKCGQNGWLANDDDGGLTICENCGWDVEAEGYIEGRG